MEESSVTNKWENFYKAEGVTYYGYNQTPKIRIDFSHQKMPPSFTLIKSKNSIVLQKGELSSSQEDIGANIESLKPHQTISSGLSPRSKVNASSIPDLEGLLMQQVQVLGKNVEPSLRNIICCARAILQKPKLLLASEEVLSWTEQISDILAVLRNC